MFDESVFTEDLSTLSFAGIFYSSQGHNEYESVERGGIYHAGIKIYCTELCTQ